MSGSTSSSVMPISLSAAAILVVMMALLVRCLNNLAFGLVLSPFIKEGNSLLTSASTRSHVMCSNSSAEKEPMRSTWDRT